MKFQKSAQFKKDFRRIKKRGADFSKLEKVLEILLDGKALPSMYHDHMLLSGEFKGSHDVHIAPDWLLVYDIQGDTVILYSATANFAACPPHNQGGTAMERKTLPLSSIERMGTHSYIF